MPLQGLPLPPGTPGGKWGPSPLCHEQTAAWGVSVLVPALRPQFPPTQWGDANPLTIPLLMVTPRKGKLRQGQASPTGPSPSPSRPQDPAELPAGPAPQVGVVPCQLPPPYSRGRRAWLGADMVGGAGRWDLSPAWPPAALTTLRAAPRQPQAQGQAEHRPGQHRARRDGHALPPLVARSLLSCGARGRAGRTRAPPPEPAPGSPRPPRPRPEVSPWRARYPACGGAPAPGRRAHKGPKRGATRGTHRDAAEAHAGGTHTQTLRSLFPAVRPWSQPCPLPPAPSPQPGAEQGASKLGHP